MEKSSISSNSIFCFINVNTKKACFYKSMVMKRVSLAVLCISFNSKFYIKKLHIYHQKMFLMVYHLISALPTILLSKNWQLPDSQKDLFASKSFSSGNVPLYSAVELLQRGAMHMVPEILSGWAEGNWERGGVDEEQVLQSQTFPEDQFQQRIHGEVKELNIDFL